MNSLAQTENQEFNSAPSRSGDRFQRDLVALMPQLSRVARSLCRSRVGAEDIAQETLTKAWAARSRFAPGSDLRAWLFAILRNEFYSYLRRNKREAPWNEELTDWIMAPPLEQEWSIALVDVSRAITELSETQRQAIIMGGAGGLAYREVGGVCGVAAGTIKSRVGRARLALTQMIAGERPLPRRSSRPAEFPASDILEQLSALLRTSDRTAADQAKTTSTAIDHEI